MPTAPPAPREGARPRSVLAVIPARYAAQRLPGKPLAPLWGKPLVQHVWERARRIPGVEVVVIATDHPQVADVARGFGAAVELTPHECPSGTDRAAVVARRYPECRIVLNLQGDEPELDAEGVGGLVAAMRADPKLRMATLACREDDAARLASPDVVKVVVDAGGCALYFSRADVGGASHGGPALRHVGVYGFTRDFLLEFASWPPSALERAERLEQLRALERGVRIKVLPARPSEGIDTPEQLEALERRGPRVGRAPA